MRTDYGVDVPSPLPTTATTAATATATTMPVAAATSPSSAVADASAGTAPMNAGLPTVAGSGGSSSSANGSGKGSGSGADEESAADAAPSSAPSGMASRRGVRANIHVIHGAAGRIACVSDIRGNMKQLNEIANATRAAAIVHTGDFGFFMPDTIGRMGDRTLRHAVQYSPLMSNKLRSVLLDSRDSRETHPPLTNGPVPTTLRQMLADHQREAVLSEFPQLLSGQLSLQVPVFTVYGACEDVDVVERVRSGEYKVPNLHLIDEATSHAIDVGALRVRLLGLGGAVVPHKLFDHGAATGSMAGGQGTMWTTMLQIGELVETAQHVYDPADVRILVSYASPGRDVLVDQLAHALQADFTMSGGLHFRYGMSYNDFGVYGQLDTYRAKILRAKEEFQDMWDAVRMQVESAIDPSQRTLLSHALHVALHAPSAPAVPAVGATSGPAAYAAAHTAPVATRAEAFKNMWHWNLPDASFGSLVMDVAHGRISTELRSQGVSFAPRRGRASMPPVKVALPAPRDHASRPGAGASAAPGASSTMGATAAPASPGTSASLATTLATLFLGHLGDAHPVSEQDVRDYFGERAANIMRVQFFPSERDRRANDKDEPRMRNFVHVVFKSEEAAKDALQCQGNTIKNTSVVPTLERLERSRPKTRPPKDAKSDEASSSHRPRAGRRGRGGRGGRGRNSAGASSSTTPASSAAKEAPAPAPAPAPASAPTQAAS